MNLKKVTTKDGNTKWEVRYYTNGRGSKRTARRFDTKADAEAHMQERTLEVRQLRLAQMGGVSFEETTFRKEAEYWLEVQGPKFSPGHLKRSRAVLKKFLPRFGDLSPNAFQPMLLAKMQSELLKSGLRPATVNRDLEVITAILNFSTKYRRIPFNPAVGFGKLPMVRDDFKFWEREEAASFLAFVDRKYPFGTSERWVYVAYFLALNTGLRAGEIWGLKPADIKQNGELLHIQRQFDRVEDTFRPTKGKENRHVPCNPVLLRELRAVISNGKSRAFETIFHNEQGNPICHDNFKNRRFGPDVTEWGGKRTRFHDLRHTAITFMIAGGLDLRTVQEIAGHKDIKTTMNYAHVLAETVRLAGKTPLVMPSTCEGTETNSHLQLVQGV